MEKVTRLYDMGEGPDDIRIRHIGTELHIFVNGQQKAAVSGVHENVQVEKNYPGHCTDIVVDRFGDRDKKREIIITLIHEEAPIIDKNKVV